MGMMADGVGGKGGSDCKWRAYFSQIGRQFLQYPSFIKHLALVSVLVIFVNL